jgi:hypothetical protein
MNDTQYLQSIRERLSRFHRIPGVHLPLYEDNAGIDLGKYTGFIRDSAFWSGKDVWDCPSQGAEQRALIAEHLVKSAQDVEELLRYIDQLESVCHTQHSQSSQ